MPKSHPLRNHKGIDGKTERRQPPRHLSVVEILNQLNQLRPQLPGKHPEFGGRKRKREEDELNWRKKSIFWELPY